VWEIKWPKLARAHPPKIDYLLVNKSIYLLLLHKMGRIKTRKSRARHFTPPLDLAEYTGQAKTPQRSGVFVAKALAQKIGIPISQELVREVTGVQH
jgi:hypothetical protein